MKRRSDERGCGFLDSQTLLDYAAGNLEAGKADLVREHSRTCGTCEALMVEQAAVWAELDSWVPEPVSDGFNRTLWQKIGEAENAPWYRRLLESVRSAGWRPAVSLAAAAAFVAVGFVFDHSAGRTAGPVASTAGAGWGMTSGEADQVESSLEDIQLLRLME